MSDNKTTAVTEDTHATPEMAALIVDMHDAMKDRNALRLFRRKLRYRIFRIREGKKEYDNGLRKWFELQFRSEMTWDNFTYEWDVSAVEPLKLVTKFEWDGVIDELGMCVPPAFTKQAV